MASCSAPSDGARAWGTPRATGQTPPVDATRLEGPRDDLDLDGSAADIGVYGGVGSDWDLDGDGYPAYGWPGVSADVPEGMDSTEFDADDLNPERH